MANKIIYSDYQPIELVLDENNEIIAIKLYGVTYYLVGHTPIANAIEEE